MACYFRQCLLIKQAHVAVFDGMLFSSMPPYQVRVVVIDGMLFSSMPPYQVHAVVVLDGTFAFSIRKL